MKNTAKNSLNQESMMQERQPEDRRRRQHGCHCKGETILWLLSRALGLVIVLGVLLGSPMSAFAHTAEHAATTTTPAIGTTNVFAYPQCTWWASARYHQLHGVYVPWVKHANAWQWPNRARGFGWDVHASPHIGSIIVLQPWVQGAYDLGHVAVVERILANGHVIASNLNWGKHPTTVTNVEFIPGPGVSFIDFTS